MQVLNRELERISAQYLGGIATDRIATVVAVLLSYVLAHVYRRIPTSGDGAYKHVFSIASTVVLFGAVQEQWWGLAHLLCGALVAHALMKTLRGRGMVAAVFLAAMAHMSYSQIRRQLAETAAADGSVHVDLDHTGAQMVFVIKITSLAWCVYDGTQPQDSLSSYQKKNAVAAVPGLLELLGYVFFFPGLAVGPAFELATYRRMVRLDSLRTLRTQTPRAYRRLGESVVWMAVYVVYGGRYLFPYMATDRFAATHPTYLSKTLYMCAAGVAARAAFYTAWKMSEGACVVAGLGFDGIDNGAARWLDISNVHVRGVELGSSLKTMIDSWNIGTNTWLRHHVYLRILQLSSSRRDTAAAAAAASATATAAGVTFLVSAWWHGFYPGYYLTFVLGAASSNAARTLRRALNPLFVALSVRRPYVKRVYDVAGWALSIYSLDFIVTPFMTLSLSASLRAWAAMLYAVPLGVLAVNVVFNTLGLGHRLRRIHERAKLE
ncbi:Lysophospholipid acyltransferase [Coemansia sp. RSA 2049]|nr:Lysophospholipid acyltransferase [Coemansia sp. RSA 2049]KAJ2689173.1 Lysophospholipid acyltransferase [Coemansia sp. RSA 1285]